MPKPSIRFIASMLRVGERRADLAPAVGEEAQRPRGGDAGSFWRSEPAAALRGLAKILPPAASCRSLSASKSALDMYTSPRTSSTSGAPAMCCGMSRDGPRIGGDVLADRAVAAGRREHQLAALVAQRAAEAVDLGLGGHRHERIGRQVEEALHPGDELADLVGRERIVEAEHRPRMGDLGERAGRRRAEPLRRRIRARPAAGSAPPARGSRAPARHSPRRKSPARPGRDRACRAARSPSPAASGASAASASVERLSHARRTIPRAG